MRQTFLFLMVWIGCGRLSLVQSAELSFSPVAISGQAAPGLGGAVFSEFSCMAISDDGRVAVTGRTMGSETTEENNQALWTGTPSNLELVARTGTPAPGLPMAADFKSFNGVALDNRGNLVFLADLAGPGIDTDSPGSLWVHSMRGIPVPRVILPDFERVPGATIVPKPHLFGCSPEILFHGTNTMACGAQLFDADPGSPDDEMIIAGSVDGWDIAARNGTPAPGTVGNFFVIITESKALAPDGRVAFTAYAEGSFSPGLWLGSSGAVVPVALPDTPVPVAVAGPDCVYSLIFSDEVAVNAQGDVAFVASLMGPGIGPTNSEFVLAGSPGNLRSVAQTGQSAPGVPGAEFWAFSRILLGANGNVAFVASYSESGSDYGLWVETPGGALQLVARNGLQAPGTPDGVVFGHTQGFVPPFEEIYLNARNQIAFRAHLTGIDVGSSNSVGIWVADSDLSMDLIVRAGKPFVADGIERVLRDITFGERGTAVTVGPEDGRPASFNDRGELLFAGNLEGGTGQGVFLGRLGIVLDARITGTLITLRFPTVLGAEYRVEYSADPSGAWSTLGDLLPGDGGIVTVTDGVDLTAHRFYRVLRTDP